LLKRSKANIDCLYCRVVIPKIKSSRKKKYKNIDGPICLIQRQVQRRLGDDPRNIREHMDNAVGGATEFSCWGRLSRIRR
jgi:hypothetical protein